MTPWSRLASDRIGDGLGGFVVEATAALTILFYLLFLHFFGRWNQPFSATGFWYLVATDLCVGAGTVAFFLLFQKGGPLSAAPAILAGGAALMAVAGITFFTNRPRGLDCSACSSRWRDCFCSVSDGQNPYLNLHRRPFWCGNDGVAHAMRSL